MKLRGREPYITAVEFRVLGTLEPDTAWQFTDGAGHVHQWVDGETPTPREAVMLEPSDDGPGVCRYECRQCGEVVNRRFRDVPDVAFIDPRDAILHYGSDGLEDVQVREAGDGST